MEPDDISEATVGTEIKISCVSEKMVQPIPHTKVKVGGQVLSESVEVTYNVTMSDAGKYLQFSCDWDQTGPDGEILFYGQEESSPVRITSPPVIESNTVTRYSYQVGDGCMNVTV